MFNTQNQYAVLWLLVFNIVHKKRKRKKNLKIDEKIKYAVQQRVQIVWKLKWMKILQNISIFYLILQFNWKISATNIRSKCDINSSNSTIILRPTANKEKKNIQTYFRCLNLFVCFATFLLIRNNYIFRMKLKHVWFDVNVLYYTTYFIFCNKIKREWIYGR